MSRYTLECDEPGCTKQVGQWYQCPEKKCGLDLTYCEEHGGTGQAKDLMVLHIETHQENQPEGGEAIASSG